MMSSKEFTPPINVFYKKFKLLLDTTAPSIRTRRGQACPIAEGHLSKVEMDALIRAAEINDSELVMLDEYQHRRSLDRDFVSFAIEDYHRVIVIAQKLIEDDIVAPFLEDDNYASPEKADVEKPSPVDTYYDSLEKADFIQAKLLAGINWYIVKNDCTISVFHNGLSSTKEYVLPANSQFKITKQKNPDVVLLSVSEHTRVYFIPASQEISIKN